jgi:hypothetical protein
MQYITLHALQPHVTDQGVRNRFGGTTNARAYTRGKPWYSHRISGKQRPESGDCTGFATPCNCMSLTSSHFYRRRRDPAMLGRYAS